MQDRSVLITGSASGIGRAACERFLSAGWRVVAADYNASAGEALAREWSSAFPATDGRPRIRFVRADVSLEADVEAAVSAARELGGRLDCVINNAGVGGAFGPIDEISVADFDYTFAVLMRGVFLGTKHAVRVFKAQGDGGCIINTGSIAGISGGSGPQTYSAAKAAVLNFTQIGRAHV